MDDISKQVESMVGDMPKHLGLVVSLDDIDKDAFSDWKREEFKEIVSDLKKIGIELKIDSGRLVLSYNKGKEGIINWDDYPIRVPEEKVRNVDMKGAGKVEQEMNKAEILNQDKEFKYRLLDRMRSDCEYYLGYGNKDAKYLWAGNEKEQIETMRAIYNSFSQNEKPEWITLEQIDGFEKEMVEMTKEQKINKNEIQIEPEVEKRLQDAYNKMSEEDRNAGLLPEELGIQGDYRDLNGDYIEDRFDPDYEDYDDYDEEVEPNYWEEFDEAFEMFEASIQQFYENGYTYKDVDKLIEQIPEKDKDEMLKVFDYSEEKLRSRAKLEMLNLTMQLTKEEYYGLNDIEKWKNEISGLERSVHMDYFNIRNQMSPEDIASYDANYEKLIYEYKMKLQNKTAELLESVECMDSERLNNPDFLECINVDKINGVYVQKEYSCEGWKVVVDMDDILKMREKNGLNSLEFKNCDIRSSIFSGEFENCKFENCSLFSCKLANAKFTNTTFQNVTFYQCVAQNVEFENCKFEKCYDDVPVIQTLKSENIKFVNTDIKDSRINLANTGTSLDLKSISLKNCSLENADCYLNTNKKYINQSITKKINSEQTLMKLLGRDLRKSLNRNEKSQEQPKDKKARTRRKGKSR